MKTQWPTAETDRTDARVLDTAQGVLIALRRYTVGAAFQELLDAAQRHRVSALALARALVQLAQNPATEPSGHAAEAARIEWGGLLAVDSNAEPAH